MQQPVNSDPQEESVLPPPPDNPTPSSQPLSVGSVYAPYPPFSVNQPYQPSASGAYQFPAQGPIIVPYPVPAPATPTEPGYNQALTSLILGAVGLVNLPMVFGFVLCGAPIALALSTLGVIFGILGLQSPSRKRLAIIGLAFSGVPIALMLLWMIVSAISGLFS